ncbi:NAD-dependent epimerase/dehydratase family protein [bacterium]|nr:NAD-dependent epimerase/dehydratase family protein [bacterium]
MSGPIAVTGATGFLGSHICDLLLDAGHQVRAAHRETSDLRWLSGKPLELVATDLDDPASVDRLLAGCTGVVHCAGVVMAPDEIYRRVNVDGTRAVVEAAARAGTVETVVHVSSLAAGGPASLDDPRDETHEDRPLTAYGRSKRDAEDLVGGERPFRAVILRPPSLYGPRDREFLPLLKAAYRGWTARFGDTMTGLSLVHGRDAAAAAVALLETPGATGVYHLDDGPGLDGPRAPGRRYAWGYDWDELRDVLCTLFDRTVNRLTIPLGLLRLASRLAGPARERSPVLHPDRIRDLDTVGWVCSAARLRRDTAWQPQFDLATGLRDTLASYRRRGWM